TKNALHTEFISHIFLQNWEYRFNTRNNAFNTISIWKIDEEANEEEIIKENR
ncbi:6683_t:CDS:1, partial [Scutellospora calospora]